MDIKTGPSVKAIIKNKLKATISYFLPEVETKNTPSNKEKDVEHLIYDLKNSRINILFYKEKMLNAQTVYALEKARFDYDNNACSALLQSNSDLYKAVTEEFLGYPRCTFKKKIFGKERLRPTQKQQEYARYKHALNNAIYSLENARANMCSAQYEIESSRANLEVQKKRYLAIVDELARRGENVLAYQKEYEKITSNIFAHQNTITPRYCSATKQEQETTHELSK